MTAALFREDAYLRACTATVSSITPEGGIITDRTIFYPTGGGQPGDSGQMAWSGGSIEIATTLKTPEDTIAHIPATPSPLPEVGSQVELTLDWGRRYRHMRVHTALHLLSVVIPLPVTGGAISAEKGRLDFDMPDAPQDRSALEGQIRALVAGDHPVTEHWITDAELLAKPDLVKTMSVRPPMGAGRVRLIQIGEGDPPVDLQPCGGTHVVRTAEVGSLALGKIEKKGRQNRRVTILLDP